MSDTSRPPGILARKFEALFSLTSDERAAVEALPFRTSEVRADQDVVREGDLPGRSCLVLSGFACSYKTTGDGRQQLLAFHVPSDMPDLQSMHLGRLDSGIATLTRCELAFIDHQDLRAVCRAHPRIAEALWRDTLVGSSVHREWMLNVSRREGAGRMAHLLCEWFRRVQSVGLADDDSCEMPLTQAQLGDALGFSAVHTNRVLQELRASGLMTLTGGRLKILDWPGFVALGDFDPLYLHEGRVEAA